MTLYYIIDESAEEVLACEEHESDDAALDAAKKHNGYGIIHVARVVGEHDSGTHEDNLDPYRVYCPACNNGILQMSYGIRLPFGVVYRVVCDCASGQPAQSIDGAIEFWQAAKDARPS